MQILEEPKVSENASRLAAYVDGLQEAGRYTFGKAEALTSLSLSEVAFKLAAQRLVEKGRLAMPRRGFYVIVPLEYRLAGAPPPSWFIDDFMAHLEHPYYVGLLSAAALHGAAHHQPQELQVVTDAPQKPAVAGRGRIHFFTNRFLSRVPTMAVKTSTGTMRVSTPEVTAIDLVRYAEGAGHLSNVGTVLAELAERIDPDKLASLLNAYGETPILQRLGYLLDIVDAPAVAAPIAKWLQARKPRVVPLRPDMPIDGAARDERWRLLVNDELEVEA